MNGDMTTNGESGPAAVALLEPQRAPTLEDEISEEIGSITQALLTTQAGEVYAKFLHEARSLARSGQTELALRKRRAARCVLKGGGGDE